MTVVGNMLRAGPSTHDDIAFLMLGGGGDLDYHGRDNVAVDRLGRPLPMFGRYTTTAARIIEHAAPLDWPAGLEALPAVEVETWVLKNAGARPWDRDPHDVRILADVAEGRGKIIDSEAEVGGYPTVKPTKRAVRSRAVGSCDDDATHARCSRRKPTRIGHLARSSSKFWPAPQWPPATRTSVTTDKGDRPTGRARRQRVKTKVTINDIARLANVSKKTVSRVINKSPLVRRAHAREGRARHHRARLRARSAGARACVPPLVPRRADLRQPEPAVRRQHAARNPRHARRHELPADRAPLRPQRSAVSREHAVVRRAAEAVRRDPAAVGVRGPAARRHPDRRRLPVRAHRVRRARRAAQHDQDARQRRRRGRGTPHRDARPRAHRAHPRPVDVPFVARAAARLRGGPRRVRLEARSEARARRAATRSNPASSCAQQLLERPPAARPTAVFAGNDEMAVGVYQAARRAGFRVPEDLSIVGFDDTPMASRIWPPLTTVRLPIREMGKAAAALLIHESRRERRASSRFSRRSSSASRPRRCRSSKVRELAVFAKTLPSHAPRHDGRRAQPGACATAISSTDLFEPDRIALNYSHNERFVIGGAAPVRTAVALPVQTEPQAGVPFLARRELGIVNVGAGEGRVRSADASRLAAAEDGLYVPMGTEEVVVRVARRHAPAKFYLVSTPAHARFEPVKISIDKAVPLQRGAAATSNERTIYQYIVPQTCKSAQLLLGLTIARYRAASGTRCRRICTIGAPRCTSISGSARTIASFISWASPTRRGTSSSATTRP